MAKHILTEEDLDTLENRCDTEIQDICSQCGYDITSIKLTNWLYILTELQRRIFRPMPSILHDTDKGSNTGRYLIVDNMIAIYGLYTRLCDKYGTVKRKRHFFQFSGINRGTIYTDAYGEEVRQKISAFRKNLEADCEDSLVAAAISDKGNPVKYIAVLNHDHRWDKEGKTAEETPRQRISIADLPRLESSHNLQAASDDDSEEDF